MGASWDCSVADTCYNSPSSVQDCITNRLTYPYTRQFGTFQVRLEPNCVLLEQPQCAVRFEKGRRRQSAEEGMSDLAARMLTARNVATVARMVQKAFEPPIGSFCPCPEALDGRQIHMMLLKKSEPNAIQTAGPGKPSACTCAPVAEGPVCVRLRQLGACLRTYCCACVGAHACCCEGLVGCRSV